MLGGITCTPGWQKRVKSMKVSCYTFSLRNPIVSFSQDKAYEIILTIGQAFEVAYQLILKNREVKDTSEQKRSWCRLQSLLLHHLPRHISSHTQQYLQTFQYIEICTSCLTNLLSYVFIIVLVDSYSGPPREITLEGIIIFPWYVFLRKWALATKFPGDDDSKTSSFSKCLMSFENT